ARPTCLRPPRRRPAGLPRLSVDRASRAPRWPCSRLSSPARTPPAARGAPGNRSGGSSRWPSACALPSRTARGPARAREGHFPVDTPLRPPSETEISLAGLDPPAVALELLHEPRGEIHGHPAADLRHFLADDRLPDVPRFGR